MKAVMAGVAAFALSLGGSTMLVMKRHPAPAVAAHADATHADVMHADAKNPKEQAEHGDSAARAGSTDSAAHAAAPKVATDSTVHRDSTPAAHGAPTTAPHAASVTAKPADTAAVQKHDPPAYRQLAKIFGNMKATDAVKVMAYMSDDEVEGVFRQLQVRQTAQLMSALPKERAAALGRRMLKGTSQ